MFKNISILLNKNAFYDKPNDYKKKENKKLLLKLSGAIWVGMNKDFNNCSFSKN